MRISRLVLTIFCLVAAGQSDRSALALAAEKTTTLTGVVVEKNEEFLIAETENMTPLALLQGVEFATENLANFVGQTVKVRGEMVTAKDGRKILRVKTMADIEKIPPRP